MEQNSNSPNTEYYKPTRELEEIKARCLTALPPLSDHHYEVLEDLEIKKGASLQTNKTSFYINEMHRYAVEQKVFRVTHMGETRGGKSEGAEMSCFLQAHFYNQLLLRGHYDNVNVDLPKAVIDFTVENVHRNKTDYIESIRSKFREKRLLYGEINQIDEKEDAPGGLGSMSELIELNNYNNMVAKYNLGEHWIEPKGFINMNTSYGIHWFIKDVKNRVNWGLLYRLEAWSKGISPQTFLGWVCFPLHKNQEFRDAYEEKKNKWIDQVISGGGDVRAELRRRAAEIIAQDPMFSAMKSEKSFELTNHQQLDIIDDYIARGEMQAFNAEERTRIMGTAQLMVKKRMFPKKFGEFEGEKTPKE